VLVKMREQETNCRRFDNTPGTRKHRATELFDERYGLSALFCSGFLARWRLTDTDRLFSHESVEIGFVVSRPSGAGTGHPRLLV
jgi:hypothetical protein